MLALVLTSLGGCAIKQAQANYQGGDGVLEDSDRPIVVLLHGFGRSDYAMRKLHTHLSEAGYLVYNLGYRSMMRQPEDIVAEISERVNACCAGQEQLVHFVGHSLGGLIIRAYLEQNEIANLGHVVLIGTPNQGTEIVDKYRDRWWMKLAGPTALALGTDANSFPNSLPAPHYPVGVIAGSYTRVDNESLVPGLDDGVVSVESTKLKSGMTDFILVESGHSSMRNNEVIAAQTVSFLKHGGFAH